MITRAQAVADELVGTCKSLHEVATDTDTNDIAFCQALDELVFECECCGWWCEMDEAKDSESGAGFVCDDCLPETAEL